MEYLKHVLGIDVTCEKDVPRSMPNYLYDRYRFQRVKLDGKDAVFVYPKTELDSISAVKKHVSRIEQAEEAPAVLVPDNLSYRQKEYLLRDHIPFIVEGKQIYLPFMALYLQERGTGEKQAFTALLPSAQVLLLYFIYRGCRETLTSDAVQDLGFTSTSISRACRQLETLGLIHTEKQGIQKAMLSDKSPKELFDKAGDHLINPIKRTIFVHKTEICEDLLLSRYAALSEYSMINPPVVEYYAASSIAVWEKDSSAKLLDPKDQCAVELWRYDPRRLGTGRCVDRLSLALTLRDDNDERVEEAVGEMLAQVWSEIDGKQLVNK